VDSANGIVDVYSACSEAPTTPGVWKAVSTVDAADQERWHIQAAGVLIAAVVIICFLYSFIVTSAQLRSRCDVWLALKASLQTVHHVLHAAFQSGC
jgi:hypothetical protein